MKRTLIPFLSISLLAFFANCNQSTTTVPVEDSTIENSPVEIVDSLALQLHRLDSLYNSGKLLHIDIYKIGKFKTIEFTVQSFDLDGESYSFINLRKDCGNDYYYSWEDARILPAECQYFINAIETIKENLTRATDHEERYAYITKDDIRLMSVNEGGGSKWQIGFSVDYRKERSEVSLSRDDIDKLIDMINKCLDKIKEI